MARGQRTAVSVVAGGACLLISLCLWIYIAFRNKPALVSLIESGLPDDDPRKAKKKEKGAEKIITTMTRAEPNNKEALTLSTYMGLAPKWKDKKNRDIERVVHKIVFNGTDADVAIPVHRNNVIGVEVARAHFPRGMYQFDNHNRFVDIRVADDVFTAAIDVGDGYSIQTMAAQLQLKMRPLAPELSGIVVGVNLRLAGLVFSNAAARFELLFRSGPNGKNSCYAELGFNESDYESGVEDGISVLRSVNRVDMSGGRYLELFSSTLANFVPDGLLCQIGMQPGSRLVNYAPDSVEIRQYPQPVQIQDMNISISMRRQAETERIKYNFNGLWWSITLNVYCVRYAIPFEVELDAVK